MSIRRLSLALGGTAVVAVPVGYVVKKHMDWMPDPVSRKRMLAHHLTFWGMAVASLALLHQGVFFLRRTTTYRPLKQGIACLVASLLPILGFEGGDWLSAKLYPKVKHPRRPSSQVTAGFPKRYTPPYLKSSAPLPPYTKIPSQSPSLQVMA